MIAGFAVAAMVCAFVVANAPRGGAVGPGVVDFVSATASIDETDVAPVTVQLMVQRTVGTDGPASVNFAVTGGSAAAAADYDTAGTNGTLNWVEGDATPQPITITVLPDNEDEPAETVVISLADPVGASLGTATQALVTINNDDDAGTVQFSSAEYAVVENESVLEVTVTRAGGSDGEVTVSHSANDGTATSTDYTGGDGTLSWANGDASPRTFTVTIDDDSASEPDETVRLELTGPTKGLELGSPATATLKIVDDAGGSGNDRFVIRTGGIPPIDGRNGSDVYRVELGGLLGPVSTLDSGSTGFDTVEIVAPDGGDDLRLSVVGDMVVFTRGADTVNMRGIESLVLDARGGIDTVTVDTNGTSATTGFSSFQLASLRVSVFSHENMRFGGSATGSRGLSTRGYWTVDTNGGVYAFGSSGFFGSTGGARLNQGVVDLAATPSGNGYWLVAADGGIFSFGDARFLGSTGGVRLNRPIIGMTPTPSGNGYWLVATDGGIFSFGDARFFGSTGGIRLNQPIVGMAATPSGNGYWLVAADGGIFSFGDAAFFGSTGGFRLNRPIVGISVSPSGNGYWLVATDGGIFAYGDARFLGSTGGIALRSPVVRMIATPSGNGYWMAAADGGIFSFGDAAFSGSAVGVARSPVVDIDAMTLP